MKIINLNAYEFAHYGRVIPISQVSIEGRNDLLDYFQNKTEAPEKGNVYVADVPQIHDMAVAGEIAAVLDYDEPQFGYCHGNSTRVNALEWHGCQELVFAMTDMVLYLGLPDKLVEVEGKLTYHTENLVAVRVKQGEMVCLNPKVLHFAPTKITEEPYRTMIVLEKGTNSPLTEEAEGHLFMTNKWLITHKDRQDLVDRGAWPGVIGENYDWMDMGWM